MASCWVVASHWLWSQLSNCHLSADAAKHKCPTPYLNSKKLASSMLGQAVMLNVSEVNGKLDTNVISYHVSDNTARVWFHMWIRGPAGAYHAPIDALSDGPKRVIAAATTTMNDTTCQA
jgi:hypothetical protein